MRERIQNLVMTLMMILYSPGKNASKERSASCLNEWVACTGMNFLKLNKYLSTVSCQEEKSWPLWPVRLWMFTRLYTLPPQTEIYQGSRHLERLFSEVQSLHPTCWTSFKRQSGTTAAQIHLKKRICTELNFKMLHEFNVWLSQFQENVISPDINFTKGMWLARIWVLYCT